MRRGKPVVEPSNLLSILTLNTWKCDGHYAARLQAMKDGLAALNADVICLQECFAVESAMGSGCGEAAAPVADTALGLARHLDMALFEASARLKRRRFAGGMPLSRSGLAILTRLPVEKVASLELPADPRDGDRIAQSLLLRVHGKALRVVNTHLTHLRDAPSLRAAQIVSVLERCCGDGVPAVIAGDLNAPLQAPELASLRLREDLDAGPSTPKDWPGTLIEGSSGADRAIDHILLLRGALADGPRLLSRKLVLDSPDARGILPSDHAGVLVTLAFT